MNFKNREDYILYLEKKKKIDRSHILFPDSASNDAFIMKVYSQQLGYYFGTYLDDSTAIRRSEFLNENASCQGRVMTNISEGLQALEANSDTLLEAARFTAFKFNDAATGQPYQFDNSSKPLKIFLIYSYSSGRLFDKPFKEIFEFADKHKDLVEIKVIATDIITSKKM